MSFEKGTKGIIQDPTISMLRTFLPREITMKTGRIQLQTKEGKQCDLKVVFAPASPSARQRPLPRA